MEKMNINQRSPERDYNERERERNRSNYNNGDKSSLTDRNEAERKWSTRRNVHFNNQDPNDTEYNNNNLNYNKNDNFYPDSRSNNIQRHGSVNKFNNSSNNVVNDATSMNVLNCVLMLLKELNDKDLYSLKLDVDRRVQK